MIKPKRNRTGVPSSLAATALAAFALSVPMTGMAQRAFYENFDALPLGPSREEGLVGTQVWTKTAPAGWTQDDTGVPGFGTANDGVVEWAGWSFADRSWWVATAGDQRRSEFVKAKGVVAIADPDEWDDAGHPQYADDGSALYFNTLLATPEFNLPAGIEANTLVMIYDSSWRPEARDDWGQTNNQTGIIRVAYNGGTTNEVQNWSSVSDDPNYKPDNEFINETVILPLNNPAGAQKAKVVIGMLNAANDWWWAVDNISIGVPPLVTGVDVYPSGFSVIVTDALGLSLDTSKGVTLNLDGQAVTATSVVKDGARTKIQYFMTNNWFAPKSNHTVQLGFTNSRGRAITENLSFTVSDFPVLSASSTVLESSVDKTKIGFKARINQIAEAHNNTRNSVERQLAGRVLDCATGQSAANLALTDGTDAQGFLPIDGFINWDKDAGDVGLFRSNLEGPQQIADTAIPAIGTFGDNIATEIITYLDLKRGAYRLGVHSDEGFVVTAGANPRNRLAQVLGIYNGARAASSSEFDFAVEQDGIYPVRLAWWQGTGNASLEFYSVDFQTEQRYLINTADEAKSIKGYQSGPNTSYVSWVSPDPGAGALPEAPVAFRVVGGTEQVDRNTLTLKFDGATVTPQVTANNDGSFTVSWTPTSPIAALSSHSAELSYTASGKPFTGRWDFTASDYATVPQALATAIGTGADTGLRLKVRQPETTTGIGSIAAAEAALTTTSSVHDTTAQEADGFFNIPYVNLERDGLDAGNFNSSSTNPNQQVADSYIPGIPGSTGSSENVAAEMLAYLEFPQPGIYTMGVNSDDGFQVSVGNATNPTFQVLGKFDAGRGAADTTFQFKIEKAGVYLFRLLYFQGTGGGSVEWFTTSPDGCRALVNGTQSGAIKSFRRRTAAEPQLPSTAGIQSVALQGANISIQYTGNLHSSTNVVGPYQPVTGAQSPYVTAPTQSQLFYIVK